MRFYERMKLNPAFEKHLSIPPGECPGGMVMHLVDVKGELLHERKLSTELDLIELTAVADGELAWASLEAGKTLYLYAYDGDTGECIGTMIAEP